MKLKVGGKLAAAFAVPMFFLIVLAAVAIAQLGAMQAHSDVLGQALYNDTMARDILLQTLNEETAVRGYVATQDASILDRYTQGKAQLPKDIDYINSHDTTDSNVKEIVAQLVPTIKPMDEFYKAEINLVRNHRVSEAAARLTEGRKIVKSFRNIATDVTEETTRIVNEATAAIERAHRTATIIMVIVALVTLLACSALTWFFGRSLSRRLGNVTSALANIAERDLPAMTNALGALADGDLMMRFDSRKQIIRDGGGDEITALSSSFNAMSNALETGGRQFNEATEKLRGLIVSVTRSSDELLTAGVQVAAATGQSNLAVSQISTAIAEIAHGAQSQSDCIREASKSVEELAQTAEQIANGAQEQAASAQSAGDAVLNLDSQIASLATLGERLAKSARQANDESQTGVNAVGKTVDAMHLLREQSTTAQEAMATLEQRSNAVGEIVTAISDIADQTNLLALNAAIEAARAGEHGRGFAVVADEIRKLAERSAISTKEITTILAAIRGETVKAATAMKAAANATAGGVERSTEATASLEAISHAIAQTMAAAQDVAIGAESMREYSAQVNLGMKGVATVAQDNANAITRLRESTHALTGSMLPVASAAEEQSVAAEQVSASAHELAAQTEQLSATAKTMRQQSETVTKLVGAFNVDDAPARDAIEAGYARVPAPALTEAA
jgi:methyl-accepting chemotaxis protein